MTCMSLVRTVSLAIAGATLLAVGTSGSVQALTLFSDNFDGENDGTASNSTLNYNNFDHWQVVVASGGVDLIGQGFIDPHAGNGLYVDLDGTGNNAGILRTKQTFDFNPGFSYALSFALGGSQRGTDETVRVRIGLGDDAILAKEYTLPSSAALTTFTETFTVAAPTRLRLFFANGPFLGNTLLNGGDNIGAILDNVRLDATEIPVDSTPIPSPSLLPGLLGLGLGFSRRRQTKDAGCERSIANDE